MLGRLGLIITPEVISTQRTKLRVCTSIVRAALIRKGRPWNHLILGEIYDTKVPSAL